ncbi:hypothetical protein ACA910_011759 [Epithemia clementina (nom. ined.)]
MWVAPIPIKIPCAPPLVGSMPHWCNKPKPLVSWAALTKRTVPKPDNGAPCRPGCHSLFRMRLCAKHPLATSSGAGTAAARTWVGSLAYPSPSMEQYEDDKDGHHALPAGERTSLL